MSVANYTGHIVSGKGSCPVCGKNKSWSYPQGSDLNNLSFVICYGSAPANPGWHHLGDTDLGARKYIKKDALRSDRATFDQIQNASLPTSALHLATIEQIDRVYRALFNLCPLTEHDAWQIHLRKFSPEQIEDMKDKKLGSLGGYRGREGLVHRLLEKSDLKKSDLLGVPGFYINKRGRWTLSGPTGLLIPSHDHKGRIQGIQIRPDQPDSRPTRKTTTKAGKKAKNKRKESKKQAKYIWLSSAKHADRGGTGSGSPIGILFPHGWRSDQEITKVKATEGFFKAWALVAISDVPVLWFAGTGSPRLLCEFLRELGSPGEIELVFDADWRTNHRVRGAICKLASVLTVYRPNQPTRVTALGWHSKYGKGIDDALLTGKMPYHEELETYDMTIDIDRLEAAQDSTFKHSHLKTDLKEIPIVWEPRKKISKEDVWAKTRAALLQMFAAPAGTFAFITAGTGGSKTHTSVHNAPRGTIFVLRNYKVLRETELLLEALGKDVRVFFGRQKEPGLLSPEATQQEREAYEAELARFDQAGCFNYQEASEAGGANHNPCAGCRFFDYHHNPLLNPDPEISCRYWSHRDALEGNLPDYLLMMPQTLLSHPEIMKGYKLVIFDDVDHLDLLLCNKITLTVEDVERWLHHPQVSSMPEVIYAFIKELHGSLQLDNKEGGWTRENLKIFALKALEAMRKELGRQRREKLPRMASCEQPFDTAENSISYPHKRLLPLLENIAKDAPYQLGSAEIEWLEPRTKALELLKERVTICLDATPRLSYWRQTLPALGFRLEVPELPRIFPKLLQLCDRLYSKEQIQELKPTIEALREHLGEEKTALFSFEGMFEGQHGHFGRDERGLNQFAGQGFEQMIVAGHFQMSEAQAKNYAWCLRSFAWHMKIAPPAASFESNEEPDGQGRVWRGYADPYRAYERKSYRAIDALVEELRRWHNSSAVVQVSSRLRNEHAPIILVSGEPLDGLEFEIPVELATLEEILSRYGVDGGDPPTQRTISKGLESYNEERQAEAEARYQDNLRWALGWSLENKKLPTQTELRFLLADDDKEMASNELTRRVLDGLLLEAAKREEKTLSEGTDWSLFESLEDLGREGEERDWVEIGSNKPGTALIKDIKGSVQLPPILSCDEPSIEPEREGKEVFSKATTEDLKAAVEDLSPLPLGERREREEKAAIVWMLTFHSLLLGRLFRLPILVKAESCDFRTRRYGRWVVARVLLGGWCKRWGKRSQRFYERGRAGPWARSEQVRASMPWPGLEGKEWPRWKRSLIELRGIGERTCESRGPPGRVPRG